MSYDFALLPRDPGQSRHQVMEASERLALEEGDRRLSPAARKRLERIASRLQAHDSQLERVTTGRYIELTRVDDTGIPVSLFAGELAVAVAYWHTGPPRPGGNADCLVLSGHPGAGDGVGDL